MWVPIAVLWVAGVLCNPVFPLSSTSPSSFSSHLPPPPFSSHPWPLDYYHYYPSTTPTHPRPPDHAPPPQQEVDDHRIDLPRRPLPPPTTPFGHGAFHHALHSSQEESRYAHTLGPWPLQRPFARHHSEVVHDYAHTGPSRPYHAHGNSNAPRSYAAFVMGGSHHEPFPPTFQVVDFPTQSVEQNEAENLENLSSDRKAQSLASRTQKQARFYQKLKDRNRLKTSRSKSLGVSKKTSSRQSKLDVVNVAVHGRRSSGPHPGFLKSYTPSCAINTNRSYCVLDDSYPSDFMADELAHHYEVLRDLWRPLGIPFVNSSYSTTDLYKNNHKMRQTVGKSIKSEMREVKGRLWTSKKEAGEGWSCPTNHHRERLSMARNTRGEWRLIVNVDGDPSLHQTTVLEECAREEMACDLLPTLVTSRCIQKYVVHNLLSWAPDKGFYVDSYSLPSACACYISRVDLHLLYTFIENWSLRH